MTDSKPRILTFDDPEPGVLSVVLDEVYKVPWQRLGNGWNSVGKKKHAKSWLWLVENCSPLTLIHDSGKEDRCPKCKHPVDAHMAAPLGCYCRCVAVDVSSGKEE